MSTVPLPQRATPAAPLPLSTLHEFTRISLYAAMVGAGAFLHVPAGPLHISLQPMMVMLAAFMLGPRRAFLALVLYVACGLLGLPMFGRGRAGPAALLGPTAGYFVGFPVAALIAGCAVHITGAPWKRLAAMLLCGTAGTVSCLLLGATLLHWRFLHDWDRALAVGFTLFLPGDLIKMTVAALIALRRPPAAGNGKAHS